MSKRKLLQTNFTSGELSPNMFGRVDTTRFQNGAAKLTNMLVRPQGGAWYRQGSRYVGEVKYSAKVTIIKEFEFSDIQPYVLEIGEFYVRIWFDGGFVETAPASGIPLEVVTPYREQDLAQLKFAQSADVLYITHPLYMPQKLRRLGANSWDLLAIVPLDGPYMHTATNATLTLSNLESLATATASAAVFSIPPLKHVTSVTSSTDGQMIITINAHGYTNGQSLNMSGYICSGVVLPYPNGNGQYIIDGVLTNTFRLLGSVLLSSCRGNTLANYYAQAVNTNQYFEYRVNNGWHLAKILSTSSTTVASVYVIQNIKADITKQGAALTYTNPNVVSDKSGSFTSDDVGAYVRISNGQWYQISAFVSDTKVTVTAAVSLIAYLYPAISITVTIPVQTATLTSSVNLFALTDVGRCVRLNYNGKQPWCKILTYISSTQVIVSVTGVVPVDSNSIATLSNGGATDVWKLGSWSDTTGFPKVVTFHEQRLWFGGSNTEPQSFWSSNSSDFENFAPSEYNSSVLDNNGITYTFVSGKANPIIWMESATILLLGTTSAELKVVSTQNQPLSPINITVTPQSKSGASANCRVVSVNHVLLFVQKAGRKLIEMVYDYTQDAFLGHNLCIVSDQIFRRGTKAIALAYQKEPNNMVWAALQDGSLAALTYEREQQVAAWHAHQLGGSGKVESICSSTSVAGTEDYLYMLVNRTINGSTKRYIEYLTADFYPVDVTSRKDMYFLDGGLTYTGAPTTNITGLLHLQNESVSIVADGVYIGEKVVSNTGVVTLTTAASTVHVGYKYRGLIQLLPLDGQSHDGGGALGKVKRIGRTLLRLLSSLEFKYGTKITQLDVKKLTDGSGITPTNDFFTGDIVVNMSMGYDLTAMPYIVQDNPYPLIVLAIGPDTEINS